MVDLTSDLMGNSLIFVIVSTIIAFGFQIYMLYLNWRQSKVKDTTERMVATLEEQTVLLKAILAEVKKK